MQEGFYRRTPGDFERMFIKAGTSETKEGLGVGEATGEILGGTLLWSLEGLEERSKPRRGCL